MAPTFTQQLRQSLLQEAALLGIRTDADAVLFERQATQVLTRVYEKEFPAFTMANGDILPINREVDPAARKYVYYTYEPIGFARIMNTYADTDIPETSVVATETEGKLVETATHFKFHYKDLRSAAFGKIPLQQMKANNDKLEHVRLWNKVGWFGSADDGVFGLLTHPNINRTLAPFKAGGSLPADRLWANKTFDEIAADVATLVNSIKFNTFGIESPTVVVLPGTVYTSLAGRLMNTSNSSNLTILKWLEENYGSQGIRFVPEWLLSAEGHPDIPEFAGLNIAVAFEYNMDKANLVIPEDYTLHPSRWEKLQWVTYATSMCGGAMIPFPLSVHVMTGI